MTQIGIRSDDPKAEYLGFCAEKLSLVHSPLNPLQPGAMEVSFSFDGTRVDCWFRNTGDNKIYYVYSDNPWCETWTVGNGGVAISTTSPALGGMNFPYVFKVDGVYYMAGVVDAGLGDGNCVHLWSSTDKVNWAWANAGNPILHHSLNGVDWWNFVYNPAIVVVGDVWHLLIEGKSATSNFRSGYSYSTLADGPNFDTNLSVDPVLPGISGNPFFVFVPERNAFLVVHGAVVSGFWELHAATCLTSSDPGLAASWIVAPGFNYSVLGIHIADPALIFSALGNGKPWGLMLGYNYDQLDGYLAYGQYSLNAFFDIITQ